MVICPITLYPIHYTYNFIHVLHETLRSLYMLILYTNLCSTQFSILPLLSFCPGFLAPFPPLHLSPLTTHQ